MVRQNRVRLSDQERRLVESIKQIKYSDSDPPLGFVIGEVCRSAIADSAPDPAEADNNDSEGSVHL